MHLRLAYLYPEIMNIYGDRGNIIALKKRCFWRGIKVSLTYVSLNQTFRPEAYDLIFAGGGQDRQQLLVAQDLQKKKRAIQNAVEAGKVFLLICGSYQLFGHYFKTAEGEKIPGIGILDVITIASDKRKIGNVLVQLTAKSYAGARAEHPRSKHRDKLQANTLVGFENHSGNTLIKKIKNQKSKIKTLPLGSVIRGYGNNSQDGTEGAVYKNVFGTYLHGSLLPKNPHFTDFLIQTALRVRYQKAISLNPLNDQIEKQAHQFVVKYRM